MSLDNELCEHVEVMYKLCDLHRVLCHEIMFDVHCVFVIYLTFCMMQMHNT
jgi:hypothetical protein